MAPALRNSVRETVMSIVVSPAFSFKGLLFIVTQHCVGKKGQVSSLPRSGKTVTFDPQGLVIGEQDAAGGGAEGRVAVDVGSAAGQGIPLTPDEKNTKKRLQDKKKRSPSHKKNTTRAGGSSDNRDRSARLESTLSKL